MQCPVRWTHTVDSYNRYPYGNLVWQFANPGSGESRSGTMTTAGALMFFGDDTGAFTALNRTAAKRLWHFQTSQTLRASPMTYVFADRRFVALASGSNVLAFGLP